MMFASFLLVSAVVGAGFYFITVWFGDRLAEMKRQPVRVKTEEPRR